MIKTVLSCLLLVCLGCAGSALTTRTVYSEPSWFVRLDTYADVGKVSVEYDHPAGWAQEDLKTILGQVFVEERVGFLEQKPPPRPLFSSAEISQLTPKLQEALHMARPSEWVAFYIAQTKGAAQEVTSGALFLKSGHLHVVLANYREQASWDEADKVRANPMRPLRRTGGTLAFDPPKVVLATQSNWMGGYSGLPASELILDHKAFLATARPLMPSPPTSQVIPASATPPPSPPFQPKAEGSSSAALKEQIVKLQEEVQRLRQKLESQAGEIARLKARQNELEGSQRKKPAKKPIQ